MSHEAESSEPDVNALTPTPTVRLAATFVTLVGFLCALSGFQLFVNVTFVSFWAQLLPWLMFLLGGPAMYAGSQVYRMRGWAALASVAAMLIASLGMGAWTFFAASHGLISCLTPLVPLGALAGLVLSMASLSTCQRADVVRARLRDAGMDLGI